MPNDLPHLFSTEDVAGLVKVFRQAEKIKHTKDEEGRLVQGPLIRSSYTSELEELFRYIINNQKVECFIKDKEYILTVYKDGMKKAFNLTLLLRHANLNHITLTPTDLEHYEHYIRKFASSSSQPQKSYPSWSDNYGFPNESYFPPVGILSYPEKLALNIYTTEFYKNMNNLLRERWEPLYSSLDSWAVEYNLKLLKDAFVHSVVAVFALNNKPDFYQPAGDMKTIEEKILAEGPEDFYRQVAFRAESTKTLSPEMLEERIKKALGKEADSITLEKAFVSTAPKKSDSGLFQKADIHIFLVGLEGQCITPLSFYFCDNEKEFLMPPIQVSWVHYEKMGNTHYFFAKPVRTLTDLSNEAADVVPFQPAPWEPVTMEQTPLAEPLPHTALDTTSPSTKTVIEIKPPFAEPSPHNAVLGTIVPTVPIMKQTEPSPLHTTALGTTVPTVPIMKQTKPPLTEPSSLHTTALGTTVPTVPIMKQTKPLLAEPSPPYNTALGTTLPTVPTMKQKIPPLAEPSPPYNTALGTTLPTVPTMKQKIPPLAEPSPPYNTASVTISPSKKTVPEIKPLAELSPPHNTALDTTSPSKKTVPEIKPLAEPSPPHNTALDTISPSKKTVPEIKPLAEPSPPHNTALDTISPSKKTVPEIKLLEEPSLPHKTALDTTSASKKTVPQIKPLAEPSPPQNTALGTTVPTVPTTASKNNQVIDPMLHQKITFTKDQLEECNAVVIKLLGMTKHYLDNLENSTKNNIKSILSELTTILTLENQSSPTKIQSFYEFLDRTNAKSVYKNDNKIKNLDIIRQDKSISALNFFVGIVVISLVILTLPVSVPILGVMYLRSGKNPLDLFIPESHQFEKEIKNQISNSPFTLYS
jgi:hypothetical protein